MDVGTRIREHREAAGLHQDQLAELCRVSRQTISNWERKHIQIWNGVLVDLAVLTGLAAGGVLTPLAAALVIAGGTALSLIGVHLDRERQRWGGPVTPPLPPQR